MKRMLVYVTWLFPFIAGSQDGVIVKQTPITLPQKVVDSLMKDLPDIQSTLAAVAFYRMTYLSDGLKVKGFLAIPKKTGRYPCVIYNRGGNRNFGKLTDSSFVRWIGRLSSNGYIIAASQYRGNDGGEGMEEFGGRDMNDVLNLIPLLSRLPQADTSRLGMYGWSRGGMMTYMALARTSQIKAAVVGSTPTDLLRHQEQRPDLIEGVYRQLIPNYASNSTEVLKERSAFYLADKINKTTPILILQGTADWRNDTAPVLDLAERLYMLRQPFRLILYEGGQHSLVEHLNDFYGQVINWFNTYLRDRKPWPSLEPHGN